MSSESSVASLSVVGSIVRPTYSALSSNLLTGVLTASSAVSDVLSPAGEAFTMLMADRVAALEGVAGSTVLLPINPPAADQVINFSYMCTCPVAFLTLRGRPGVHTSFAEVIGFTDDVLHQPLATGLTVQFPTPEFFLVAKGDLLASSQRRPLNTSEPEAKRSKVAQPVIGGELTSPSGERAILHITDLEGGKHVTRSKSDLYTREQDLRMGFRVVERERWPHLMGGDLLLQPAEYARIIIEQARTRPQHRDVAFHTCGLLVHVEELGFAYKTEKLRSLINGNVYGVGKGTPVEIQDFESPGSPISTATGVDRLRNRNLVTALENVQLVMEVFYSPAFENALGTFIGHLKSSAQPMMLVTAAYLKHSVELQLTTFFRVVRSKKIHEPPLVALSTPKECAAYLASLFATLAKDLSDHAERKLGEDMFAHSLEMKKANITQERKSVKEPLIVKEEKSVRVSTGVKSLCFNFFGQSVKAVHEKTQKPYKCDRGNECIHDHSLSKGLTKKELLKIADSMPYHSRSDCRTAISGMAA